MMDDSIFSPSFGNRPSMLVGREAAVSKLIEGLSSKPGSKERATVLLGQRGMGKTVLLWELADRARERGIVVASPTVVSSGMLERIIEKVQTDGERYVKSGREIVGGSVGAFGFSVGLEFNSQTQESKSFGYKILHLAERLGEQGRGLLILVDELQANSPELKELLISYAELVGERQNVSIVLAGLPGSVSSLLNDHVLTFLNRANKMTLDPLEFMDIDAFYADAFKRLGLTIGADVRREASKTVMGSPYMLQLLGYNIVRYAGEDRVVTRAVLEDAIYASQHSFEEDVCKTTLAALSERDADFLAAMAQDNGASRISDIAHRMGVSDDYAQKYRKRLKDGGIITQERRGFLRFDVPYLADYLRHNE